MNHRSLTETGDPVMAPYPNTRPDIITIILRTNIAIKKDKTDSFCGDIFRAFCSDYRDSLTPYAFSPAAGFPSIRSSSPSSAQLLSFQPDSLRVVAHLLSSPHLELRSC